MSRRGWQIPLKLAANRRWQQFSSRLQLDRKTASSSWGKIITFWLTQKVHNLLTGSYRHVDTSTAAARDDSHSRPSDTRRRAGSRPVRNNALQPPARANNSNLLRPDFPAGGRICHGNGGSKRRLLRYASGISQKKENKRLMSTFRRCHRQRLKWQ